MKTTDDDLFCPCEQCGGPTRYAWYRRSGGLCGICLADLAVPLTRIVGLPRARS